LRKSVFIVLLLLTGLTAYSQAQPSLKGRVVSKSDNKPVEMTAVVIKELNIWSTTDENGNYTLRSVPDGKYTLVVTCLGYVPFEEEITFPYTKGDLNLFVEESTLALDEIVVVAKEGKRMGSGSVISQTAIQHTQPADLSDVLQLMPGQIAMNPDLSDPKQLSIREIQYPTYKVSSMASLGTALIIDGASVSNDANMQFYSTATASGGLTSSASTTAGAGSDVRQISVDNIESIEVVRGIGSVESGDMLSGAVKVTMKKGKSPFNAKVKVDPNIKQLYASKGFDLGKGRGTLNTDFNYTKSVDDIREDYKTLNLLNAGVTWSNTLMKETRPLTTNISVRGSQTIDTWESDPDLLDIESFKSDERSFSFNMNGKWALNTKLLTNLNYLVSGNFQHQISREIEIERAGSSGFPQPVSYVSGEFEVPTLPTEYMSDYTIDGRPYYFESKISGNKSFYVGKILNNINTGVEWKLYGNNGDGRMFDLSRPPAPNVTTTARPTSFKRIPGIDQLSLYLEENLDIPVGNTRLNIQAGLRYANLQPDGLFSSEKNITMLDPRTNLRYTIIDNGSNVIKKLTIRGGYGLFSKAPTMPYLYPDNAYWDKLAFSYYDSDAQEGLAVVQTKLYENVSNDKLKAAKNRKLEGGFDVNISGIDISVTAYSETTKNNFSFEKQYQTLEYNDYASLTFEGAAPYYVNGEGIYFTNTATGLTEQLSSVKDTVFTNYSVPSNNGRTIKSGVEFTIDFGNIKSIRTSFILDGALMKVKDQETMAYWERPTNASTTGSKEYPYIALYPEGSGSIKKRFSTNLRSITHIKELKMVFSATLQVVWFRSLQYIYEDKNGKPYLYTETAVDDVYSDCTTEKYLNPVGYIDHAMIYHEFDPTLASSKPYSDLIKTYYNWFFTEKIYDPYYQINLKLTKEISSFVELSFFANNITNYRPAIKIRNVPFTYDTPNPSLYFGAELKIKF